LGTKVHKITLCVIDHDECGMDSIKTVIENARYPNRCISPTVHEHETKEVEWSDDHPLNLLATHDQAFKELFDKERATPEMTELARQKYAHDSSDNIKIDDKSPISDALPEGVWVQAWVWLYSAELGLDEEE